MKLRARWCHFAIIDLSLKVFTACGKTSQAAERSFTESRVTCPECRKAMDILKNTKER